MTSKNSESAEDALWQFYNGLLLSPDVDRIRKLLRRKIPRSL